MASNGGSVPLSERAYRTPDWEIRRELRPGTFRAAFAELKLALEAYREAK